MEDRRDSFVECSTNLLWSDEVTFENTAESDKHLLVSSVVQFYMQLQAKYLVPASTIQYIVDEIQEVFDLNYSRLFSKLFSDLTTKFNISCDEAKDLLNEVRSSDFFIPS